MKKFLTALAILAGFCLAENPICSNRDKNIVPLKSCFAYNDFQFLQFFEDYPTDNSGNAFQDSGTAYFEKYTELVDEATFFEKKGIIYKRYPNAQYTCNYQVVEINDDADDFNLKITDFKYVVSYGCEYRPIDKFDTAFAETEFQKKSYDGLWQFYRKDGTLKFSGNKLGGYCMSTNGLKTTKRVSNPAFCN